MVLLSHSQGPSVRVPPARGGAEGPQCPALTMARPACGGVADPLPQDEEGHVCRRRGHTEDEDGHGGWQNGPGGIPHQIHCSSQDRRHMVHTPLNNMYLYWRL